MRACSASGAGLLRSAGRRCPASPWRGRARLPSASAARSSSPWRRFISKLDASAPGWAGAGWAGQSRCTRPSSSGGRQKNSAPARKPSARLTARQLKIRVGHRGEMVFLHQLREQGRKALQNRPVDSRWSTALPRPAGASGAACSACTAASRSAALAEKTTRQSPGSAMPKCSSFISRLLLSPHKARHQKQ